MLGNCGLAPDVNRCPHYIEDKRGCGADHKECGFFVTFGKPGESKETIMYREPKWFERYQR